MEDIHKLIGNGLNSSTDTQPHFTAGNCYLDLDENKTYLRETTLLWRLLQGTRGGRLREDLQESQGKRVFRKACS